MNELNLQTLPLVGQTLIEASAGTGKTYTISHLVLRLVLLPQEGLAAEALSVKDILVVTFTKAATQELRDRIRAILHQAKSYLEKTSDAEKDLADIVNKARESESAEALITRCYQAILQLDDAPIYTIHGFCQKMLNDFSFSMGQPVAQTLMENPQALRLQIAQAFWRELAYQADEAKAELIQQTLKSPENLLSRLGSVLSADIHDPLAGISLDDCLVAYDKKYAEAQQLWGKDKESIRGLFLQGIGGSYNKKHTPAWLSGLDAFLSNPSRRYCDYKNSERFSQLFLDEKLKDKAPQHPLYERMDELLSDISLLPQYLLSHTRTEMIARLSAHQAEHGIVFFDDLIKNLYLATETPALCEAICARYPVALIDEFQDTDQYQYRIFERIYYTDKTCLLMIGDPKQAIYGFRGADIHAYFEARKPISGDKRFTLKTNHRTVPSLVHHINQLFQHKDEPFVLEGFPDFIAVDPASYQQDTHTLIVKGESLPIAAFPLKKITEKPLTKDQGRAQAAAATASWIKHLLANKALVKGKVVEPNDIAILVRKGSQASIMKKALAKEGINSVYLAKESVLTSDEARSFGVLLQAVIEPFNNRYINMALGDSLIAWQASKIRTLNEDVNAFTAVQQCFVQAKNLWQTQSFFSCFNRLMAFFSIAENILRSPDGERRLTNIQQISEVFHDPDYAHLSLFEQWQQYTRRCEEAEGGDETQKLRLETEANLVEIVTIHASKGLEYPVVCCPFLFDIAGGGAGKSVAVSIYDQASSQRQVSYALTGDQKKLHEKNNLSEEVRLLYVALTRAKCHVNFCWGDVRDVEKSPMYHLLFGRLTSKGDDLFASLETLNIPLIKRETYDVVETYQASEVTDDLQILPLNRSLSLTYYARSYSALVNKVSHQLLTDDYGDEKDRDRVSDVIVEPVVFEQNIFHFPKGSEAGNFLHQVLEDVDFSDSQGTLMATLDTHMPSYGFDEDLWKDVIHQHIEICLAKSLAPSGCALSSIESGQLIKEMGFQFCAKQTSSGVLHQLLAEYRQSPVDIIFNPIQEDFKGFIDLIFCHEGKYYVLDYKSNFLGFTTEDYHQTAMHEAIESHVYDLQFLIYQAALQRYLKTKLTDFSYEKHMGGVFYLFLRGMNEHDDAGIYFRQPEQAIIDKFDALFDREGGI